MTAAPSPHPELRDRLIYANSEHCADLFYACRFMAPDPFAFLQVGAKKMILLSPLELDRGEAQAKVDGVHSLRLWEEKAAQVFRPPHTMGKVLTLWLKAMEAQKDLAVPHDFPLLLAQEIAAYGFRLHPQPAPFWPEREIKQAEEIAALRQAVHLSECGMERAFAVLRASRPGRGGVLRWRGQVLTAERLRAEIDTAILHAGGVPTQTIVAGGEQACDPHERGTGPLHSGELIILDIFPRDARTGYYGDLTRTVVRGTARPELRTLWETCLAGQELALRRMRPRRSGKKIHQEIVRFFTEAGYPTDRVEGRWRGFFHGTGHGLGLEVHEYPRFGSTTFRVGQVLTVEPGIYWPGLGGVRHEDVVVVRSNGVEKLSQFPKPLEL